MTYTPVNGRLISFDIEDAKATGGWRLEKRHDGYLGDGYMRWLGGNQYGGPTANGVLSFSFEATQAGPYFLTARARRDYDGASYRKDEANDFYVRVDGGAWTKFLFSGATPFGQWGWAQTFDIKHQSSPAMFALDKGLHVIEFAGRSNGAALDRIYLNLDSRSLNVNAPLSPVKGEPGPGPNPDPGPGPNPDPGPDPGPDGADLVIRAGGTGTAGASPSFEVFADGVSLGVRSITAPLASSSFNVNKDANFQNYGFDLKGAKPAKIEIVYFNDGTTGGVNRNLFVDYIDVNGKRLEAETSAVFEPANPSSPLGGARESAFVNGRFVFETAQPGPAPTPGQLVVRAGGNGTDAAPPRFEVFADGVSLGVRSIASPVAATGFDVRNDALFESFVFTLANAPKDVRIAYLNDGSTGGVNRNLFVDYIEFAGARVEAEEGAVFAPANGDARFGGARESAYVNGAFLFDDLLFVA